MSTLTFNEIAEQQFRRFVDYMCLLTGSKPEQYEIFLTDNSQLIQFREDGLPQPKRLLHDIRLKSFVGKLSVVNEILEVVITNQQ